MTRISMIWFFTLVVCSTTFGADAILRMNAKEWKYLDTGAAPEENWFSADFDDSQWKSGQAPLGYGDDDIKQEVSFGGDSDDKHVTTFFRRTIDIDDALAAIQFQIQVICDDGCVAYINGKELFRHNMPQGEFTDETTTPSTTQAGMERHKFTFVAAPEKLKSGVNTIAVRVHQRSKDSSDLAFDMSLTPLLTDAEVEKAKQALEADKSIVEAANNDNNQGSQRSQRPPRPRRPSLEDSGETSRFTPVIVRASANREKELVLCARNSRGSSYRSNRSAVKNGML